MPNEEFIEAAKAAREKWPSSFSGEYNGRPKIVITEISALKADLKKGDEFKSASMTRGAYRVKR
jgi:hypothetical protein